MIRIETPTSGASRNLLENSLGRPFAGGQTERNVAIQTSATTTKKSFPLVLHKLLDDADSKGTARTISWQPNGQCFRVHDMTLFVTHFLPKFFNLKTWASFEKQLDAHGFSLVPTGVDKGSYKHAFFQRGQPEWCGAIGMNTTKITKMPKGFDDPEQTVDIQSMPSLDGPLVLSGEESSIGTLMEPSDLSHCGLSIDDSFCSQSGAPNDDSMSQERICKDIFDKTPCPEPKFSITRASSFEETYEISDDPMKLQEMYTLLGAPFKMEELDMLPRDDRGWGDLLDIELGNSRSAKRNRRASV